MNRSLRIILAGAAAAVTAVSLTACSGGGSGSVVGTWGEPDVEGQPSLILSEDGSLGGNDGCNTLFGDYTVEDTTVEFGTIGSTMMFCEGVDTWLTDAATATLDGNRLVVSNAAGEEIGALDRA